ncbi:hypothetical protein P7K49_003190 [Saguinus oedipus]|uniref:Uncharacterized protein n=1 Tax=Saguinus oedipus TaxID=9490 RepID=A0ABQ9WJG1_SAGOE|nr:hypothetical protein P7K49_003190 [Saguinus oedipus]
MIWTPALLSALSAPFQMRQDAPPQTDIFPKCLPPGAAKPMPCCPRSRISHQAQYPLLGTGRAGKVAADPGPGGASRMFQSCGSQQAGQRLCHWPQSSPLSQSHAPGPWRCCHQPHPETRSEPLLEGWVGGLMGEALPQGKCPRHRQAQPSPTDKRRVCGLRVQNLVMCPGPPPQEKGHERSAETCPGRLEPGTGCCFLPRSPSPMASPAPPWHLSGTMLMTHR